MSHFPGCRHDMILMCIIRGEIAHRMHCMIHRGMCRVASCIRLGLIFLFLSLARVVMHIILLMFVYTGSPVVLNAGHYRLLALKYRISKSQNLIDQNEREVAT